MPYAEVFDRELVLRQLDLTKKAIEKHMEEGGGDLERDGEVVTEAELRDALQAIRDLETEAESKDAPEIQPSGVYLPRNPLISCLQSGIEKGIAAESQPASMQMLAAMDVDEDADLVEAIARQPKPLPPVTDQHVPEELGGPRIEELRIDPGSYDPFPGDPGWAMIGVALARRALFGKHKYNPEPAVADLDPDARMYLFSDWGSGIERAVALSGEVRHRIRDSAASEHHVVHLGDVYYAGWPHEYEDHVLKAWPVPASDPGLAKSWILCGNHDMYYGGGGYYKTCLEDPRFQSQRSPSGDPTSIFELNNENWKVLGLDSGWVDVGLWDKQRDWLTKSIEDAESNKQSVLLLSHHQLFSAFAGHIDEELRGEVGEFLREHPVRAWFWGHEHRCTVYKPQPEVKHAVCIGNGGVPAHPTAHSDHPEMVELDFEELCPPTGDNEKWVRFAFAQLEFDGPNLHVIYVDEDGNEFFTQDM